MKSGNDHLDFDMDMSALEKYLRKQDKKLRFSLSLSGIGLFLFVLIAFTAPFQSSLLSLFNRPFCQCK